MGLQIHFFSYILVCICIVQKLKKKKKLISCSDRAVVTNALCRLHFVCICFAQISVILFQHFLLRFQLNFLAMCAFLTSCSHILFMFCLKFDHLSDNFFFVQCLLLSKILQVNFQLNYILASYGFFLNLD